jgi:cyclase
MRFHRIIPVLLYCNGYIVRSQQFSKYFRVGDPFLQLQRYIDWDPDEIIYLDITPKETYLRPLSKDLPLLTNGCFTPITTGGNIHCLEDIESQLESGADRVVLGSIAAKDPDFVDRAANLFGSQAIVISVDYKKDNYENDSVFINNGKICTNKNLINWVNELHSRGAGEILLHSIDRDGMGGGYDLNLLSKLTELKSLPLIICGGASSYLHFSEALSNGASAVAASNIFSFKELSYLYAKEAVISSANLKIRPPNTLT